MMPRLRRPSGPLLFSLVAHAAVGLALVNAAFHYDFTGLRRSGTPSPAVEAITYVRVGPAGGAEGGSGAVTPARAAVPTRSLVAPGAVPTSVPNAVPSAPLPPAGTAGGTPGGTGIGGGRGEATGIVPGERDPRLSADGREFVPAPKSHAQRVDSAVHAMIYAFNDSVARAAAEAGRKPGDWTFEKNGKKWGIDGNKIYLGKFAIPSAVLAALPIKIQGNPGATISDRLSTTRRGEVLEHAQSQYHDVEFKSAVKRIRERKDRERREREQGRPLAGAPGGGR